MTDNEIIPIDIEKYAEALNNLIGMDSAYFGGDKDVDAIVEIIKLAKKMESIINRQKVEIERLRDVHADMNESLRLAAEANKDMQAEIEWLKSYIKRCVSGEEYWVKCLLEMPNEAIKEFAERLKEKRGHDFPFTGTVFVEEIDDLVKEITEEVKHD